MFNRRPVHGIPDTPLMPQRLLADRDFELVPQPLGQIDNPPAYHAMGGRDRPGFDDFRQRAAVSIIEDRRRARRALRIKTNHPIAHNLPRHAADKRSIAAAATVQDRRYRQQTPNLRTICNRPIVTAAYGP